MRKETASASDVESEVVTGRSDRNTTQVIRTRGTESKRGSLRPGLPTAFRHA